MHNVRFILGRGGYKQERGCTRAIFVSVSEDPREPMTIYRSVLQNIMAEELRRESLESNTY